MLEIFPGINGSSARILQICKAVGFIEYECYSQGILSEVVEFLNNSQSGNLNLPPINLFGETSKTLFKKKAYF